MTYKRSFIGGALAFVIATSCCWLPALIITIGGGSALIGLSNGLEQYSGVFITIGALLLGLGIYQYIKNSGVSSLQQPILQSIITCPECGHKKEEEMPTDACQYFYECDNCKSVLKPVGTDCCVYCSYGTVPCPPIQMDEVCC